MGDWTPESLAQVFQEPEGWADAGDWENVDPTSPLGRWFNERMLDQDFADRYRARRLMMAQPTSIADWLGARVTYLVFKGGKVRHIERGRASLTRRWNPNEDHATLCRMLIRRNELKVAAEEDEELKVCGACLRTFEGRRLTNG